MRQQSLFARRAAPRAGALVSATLAVIAAACGGSPPLSPDAGAPRADAGEPDASSADERRTPRIPWLVAGRPDVAPPAPPAWTCPAGWERVTPREGAPACDPWPSGAPVCGEGRFLVPSGCRDLGRACPATGEFPSERPATGTVRFVRAGAAGDGSEALPFGTVSEALSVAAAGDVVLVAAGTYDEILRVPAGVTIEGACPADTILTSSAASTSEGLIEPLGAGVVVRQLSFVGAERSAVRSRSGTAIELEHVLASGITYGAFIADAGAITLRDVAVRGTRPRPDGRFGIGVVVQYGAQVLLEHVEIDASQYDGVYALDEGSGVALTDVYVHGTRADSSGANGFGVEVQTGAHATLRELVVEDCETAGVFVWDPGTEVEADSLLVRDTRPEPNRGIGGAGLMLQRGSTATVRGALFQGNHHRGVAALEGGGVLTLEDVVVAGTLLPTAAIDVAAGLEVWEGPEVHLARVALVDNFSNGIFVSNASIEGSDVRIAEVLTPEGQQGEGDGIAAQLGAHVSITRLHVERAPVWSILVIGEGAELTLSDLTIVDGYRGVGLVVRDGAHADVRRAVIERSLAWGLFAQESRVDFEDVAVLGTLGIEDDAGIGIVLRDGTVMNASRLLSSGGQWAAFLGHGERIEATLEDVVLRGTEEPVCAMRCETAVGIGLTLRAGAHATLTRFAIEGNDTAGIQLLTGGALDLRSGFVRDQLIGLNLQVPGYDISRLTADVLWRNEVNLDANELPVPSAGEVAVEPPPEHD